MTKIEKQKKRKRKKHKKCFFCNDEENTVFAHQTLFVEI